MINPEKITAPEPKKKGNCSQFLNSEIGQDRLSQQAEQRLERGLSAQFGSIPHGG
jgi:hypothetical protein